MENSLDFVEHMGADAAASILRRLDDPGDLVRASAVSRAWQKFVITHDFCKILCFKICPEISNFTQVMEVNKSQETVEVGSSSDMEGKNRAKDHRLYAYLCHCIISPIENMDCIHKAIAASSTDNYPSESIVNTLIPRTRVGSRPSYWSSGGQWDPQVPETLTYRLCSKLCVINEIKVQPFEAYFQDYDPIYSAQAVRLRMGHSRLSEDMETASIDATGSLTGGDNYIWTYVSPEFPMLQESTLQSFRLPRPVLCIGGVVQIELLGRVQKQEMDDMYYICICNVQVIGCPLSPTFDVEILESPSKSILMYFPVTVSTSTTERSKVESLEPHRDSTTARGSSRVRSRGWLLNTMLRMTFRSDKKDANEQEER